MDGDFWHPTETAPKDGRFILLLCPGFNYEIRVGCWRDGQWTTFDWRAWTMGSHVADKEHPSPTGWRPFRAKLPGD